MRRRGAESAAAYQPACQASRAAVVHTWQGLEGQTPVPLKARPGRQPGKSTWELTRPVPRRNPNCNPKKNPFHRQASTCIFLDFQSEHHDATLPRS